MKRLFVLLLAIFMSISICACKTKEERELEKAIRIQEIDEYTYNQMHK